MHSLSLSHGHNLEPSLMAFLGDTLCPSSSSRPASTGQCPSQAPCCNPACRFLGKAAALARSLSKACPQHRPHCRSTVIPWLHPKTSQLPTPTSPITAMSTAAPISMLNPIMPCPPWDSAATTPGIPPRHHSSSPPKGLWQCTGDPHEPRGGNAAGDQLVTSPALPDFVRCHSLTSQPCPGDAVRPPARRRESWGL